MRQTVEFPIGELEWLRILLERIGMGDKHPIKEWEPGRFLEMQVRLRRASEAYYADEKARREEKFALYFEEERRKALVRAYSPALREGWAPTATPMGPPEVAIKPPFSVNPFERRTQ